MNNGQLLKIVEQYSRKSQAAYGEITVTRVPDQKTVFVEQTDGIGRAILMDKYEVDGATYWAGYSSRSETVYISVAA
jgi:meiotically up-regulated gene 157 (Mug157) protein